MSIPLSTDLIAGVASAADPVKLKAAAERLASIGAANGEAASSASGGTPPANATSKAGAAALPIKTGVSPSSFSDALNSAMDAETGLSALGAVPPGLAAAAGKALESKAVESKTAEDKTGALSKIGSVMGQTPNGLTPAQKFEAFVLQNFVELMLPKEAENVYGSGVAGGYWKSMMAEQMAAQLAKTGKLGVAETLDKAKAGPSPVAPGQTYRSASPLTAHLSKLPYDGDRN